MEIGKFYNLINHDAEYLRHSRKRVEITIARDRGKWGQFSTQSGMDVWIFKYFSGIVNPIHDVMEQVLR